MSDKTKLSDETIKKVSGGDVPTNMICPGCHNVCLWDGSGRFYCPDCGYSEAKS